MRALVIALAGFVFVAADISANHGAVIHSWATFMSSVAQSVGL
jgi:hypothetical protein